MTTYSPAKIGIRKSRTAEGFLRLHDVRLSRVGDMNYGPGETPIPVGPGGVAVISRDEQVVFDAATLSSFIGKPVTIGHPAVKVEPANWAELAGGHIENARRGAPPFDMFMVGDVLVTKPEAIALADAGCEISTGYDAAYEQVAPGRGKQTRIVGNHLAFLPDGKHGRCGPMCYIGDQAMDVEEPKMDVTTPRSGVSLLQRLFGAKDEAAVSAILTQAAADEAAADKAEIARLKGLLATKDEDDKKDEESDEDKAKREAKEKADKDKPTMDAASVTALRTRIASAAEILSPGFVVPTVDAAGDLVATFDSLCGCQRKALDAAYATPQGKVVIDALVPGFTAAAATMTADQIGANFFAAASMLGASRNASVAAMLAASGGFGVSEVQSNIDRSKAADARSKERWAAVRAERNAIHH